MFNFIPESAPALSVPFFEDVSRDEGWQGYRTTKTVKKLQAEIGDAIGRLGGIVSSFQRGPWNTRKRGVGAVSFWIDVNMALGRRWRGAA